MSFLFPNYGKQPFEIVSGQGCCVVDNYGQEYIDLTSGIGVMNLGYQVPELQAALKEQSEMMWHMPNLYQSHLQEEVASLLGKSHDYLAFFCNSGTEANEAAIKLARKATGRTKIITFEQSFHGRTYGGMSATGQAKIHEGFAPLVPGFTYVPYNQFAPLSAAIDQNTAAVMLEVIQGEGGVVPAEAAWLKKVAALCREMGTLLIVDEVQTGIGRIGSLFAFEQFGIEPDIVTLAKGLGNGFPVGAMLGKAELAKAFGPGSHGSTFGGNKLAMSVAKVVLEQMTPALFSNVVERSNQFFQGLTAIDSDLVQEVRGKGLMIGLELPNSEILTQVMANLQKQGILVLRAGQNVLRLLPPLTISEAEVATALTEIEKSLRLSTVEII